MRKRGSNTAWSEPTPLIPQVRMRTQSLRSSLKNKESETHVGLYGLGNMHGERVPITSILEDEQSLHLGKLRGYETLNLCFKRALVHTHSLWVLEKRKQFEKSHTKQIYWLNLGHVLERWGSNWPFSEKRSISGCHFFLVCFVLLYFYLANPMLAGSRFNTLH